SDISDAGSLRVGASVTVGSTILPPVLRMLRTDNPRLRLHLAVDNTAAIIEGLSSAELDIACVEGMSEWSGILAEDLYEDELGLICGPDDALASSSPVSLSDLRGRGFIVRESGSGTRETFVNALSAAGIDWEELGVVNSTDAIIELVACGLGLSFVSRLLSRGAVAEGRVRAVELGGFSVRRRFRLVRRRGKQETELMEAFSLACRRLVESWK
ncbi:MAG TPA: LysR substrate-binding domain-containing protein, partial [Rectinemataceae bacterium]|nr:LysR substrate-binding domain-containing protein [Rectinemataceae bacterium]